MADNRYIPNTDIRLGYNDTDRGARSYYDTRATPDTSGRFGGPVPAATSAVSDNLNLRKRLIVCCDGTLNDSIYSKRPLTNVSRLARCIQNHATDGTPQVVYYHSGVGTTAGGRISRSVDAITGRGKLLLVSL